jgi:2-keto-3-deoxy-L-rhamnonate aldolase RhmA
MTPNPVRLALLERRVTIGTWIQIGHPAVAEVLAGAGYDWLCADSEHTDIGPAEFAALARACHGRGPVPLVRVHVNDTLAIRQMLDLGAMGVIVPLVNTAAEAQAAVRAAKYPPQGVRGFAFHRGNNWGVDFADYAAQANAEIAVVVMIESRQAVENIEAILAVDGVDGVFIGPYDMSGSYGLPGKTADPVIRKACTRVVDACRDARKSAGLHVVLPTPDSIEQTLSEGFTFIALGVDTVFLQQAARQTLETAHRVIGA